MIWVGGGSLNWQLLKISLILSKTEAEEKFNKETLKSSFMLNKPCMGQLINGSSPLSPPITEVSAGHMTSLLKITFPSIPCD